MEPRDGDKNKWVWNSLSHLVTAKWYANQHATGFFALLYVLSYTPRRRSNVVYVDLCGPYHECYDSSLRLRGGGKVDDAQYDNKSNDIPALTKMNFIWNGQPSIDFNERVLYVFMAGLGSVSNAQRARQCSKHHDLAIRKAAPRDLG